MQYRKFEIKENYYAGFAAVTYNGVFVTLASTVEGAKQWVDVSTDYFGNIFLIGKEKKYGK